MTSSFRNVTVDCRDPLALGRFWAAVLGWNVYFDDDPEVLVAPAYPPSGGPTMLFIRVPEPRMAKNRVHVDFNPYGPYPRRGGRSPCRVGRYFGRGPPWRERGGPWLGVAGRPGGQRFLRRTERARACRDGEVPGAPHH